MPEYIKMDSRCKKTVAKIVTYPKEKENDNAGKFERKAIP